MPTTPQFDSVTQLKHTPEVDARSHASGSDTGGIQEAIDIVAAVGGGAVLIPAGTTTLQASIILPNAIPVMLRGMGTGCSKLILANGVNADVITNANFATLTGSNTFPTGVTRITISDMTIDGNKANQSAGWGIRLYGYGYRLRDLVVQNTKSGGIYGECALSLTYLTPAQDNEAYLSNIRVIFSDGNGIVWRGPHDSFMTDIIVYQIGGWGIKFETDGATYNGNAFINHSDTYLCALTDSSAGGVYSNVSLRGSSNTFTTATGYGLYMAGQTGILNGVFGNNDATKPGVYLGLNNHYITGNIVNSLGVALEIACQQSIIDAVLYGKTNLINFSSDAGHNVIRGTAQGSGNYAYWTGTPNDFTDIDLKNITSTSVPGAVRRGPYLESWKKYTVSITGGTWTVKSEKGLSTVAGDGDTSQAVVIVSQITNAYVTGLVLKTSTAFSGATTATANFGTNYAGTLYYAGNYDLKVAVAGDNFAPTDGKLANYGNSRLVDAVDLVLTVTTTGANISALVGALDIWVRTTSLP